jgi:hypothetical protein
MLGIEQTDITAKISDYAVGFSYADASESAIMSAKLFTLECVGHMLSGARQPVGGLVVEMIRELGAVEQACVFGGAFRTSIAEAAYVNGALAHADELEACGSLPGTGLIPPITAGLAVGEARRSSGTEYLAALIAGVEVQGRLGTAVIGACDRGFMGFALVGPAGAGITAGKLLGLDSDGMRACLGAALPLAGGSLRGDGYMSHVHEAGVPSRTGVWPTAASPPIRLTSTGRTRGASNMSARPPIVPTTPMRSSTGSVRTVSWRPQTSQQKCTALAVSSIRPWQASSGSWPSSSCNPRTSTRSGC